MSWLAVARHVATRKFGLGVRGSAPQESSRGDGFRFGPIRALAKYLAVLELGEEQPDRAGQW